MASAKLMLLCILLLSQSAVYANPLAHSNSKRQSLSGGQLPVPSTYAAPRFRWWWPGGWIDPDVVKNEIQAIAAAGFGGGEIGDVEDSIKVSMDPKIYGWARERWNAGIEAAYKAANKLGVYVDLTLGPHWPTGVPGYTPDSPETSKELVHGQLLLNAGNSYSGSLTLPIVNPSGTNATSVNDTVIGFEPSTLVNITQHYAKSKLTWTAPSDGKYIVAAVYGRGTGQIQNLYDSNTNAPEVTYPFPAYIVDHLSPAGVQASVQYYNKHILSDEIRALLKASGGSLFEDSLELKLKQYWTLDFIAEFTKRRGYDLTPYLLYVLKDRNTFTGDDNLASRIEYDFLLNGHGLPYTATFYSSRAASAVDIPEGESLGFDGDNDAFRVLATERDIAGKTRILSNELGAYMGKAYGVTWNFLLGAANLDYSLGVSQAVIHSFPYRDSPSSEWPGFAPFTPLGESSNGFADAWGPRMPQWLFASNASSYMARAHATLQTGVPSVDLAILKTDWGVTATWEDTGLNNFALKNSKQVSTQSDAPAALQALGVSPIVKYSSSANVSMIATRHRLTSIQLEGEGYPLAFNLWTGEVVPIAAFSTNGGYTSVNISLGENGAQAIYLGQNNPYGVTNLKKHVTTTDAEIVADKSNSLYIRASKNGTYSASLSTGKLVHETFNAIPTPVELSSWLLSVEDWAPRITNETGLQSSFTTKTILSSVKLDGLKAWPNIMGLEYASGIGIHKTTIQLSLEQTKFAEDSLGVRINLAEVEGSWSLKINGVHVDGIDFMVSAPLDVTSYVREGSNGGGLDIEIIVATTLWNKLHKTWPSLYGSLEAQDIGLLGPVNLTYYAERQI
ncbi:hypothetical protein N7462_001353 [Penicillium macrosclerotiorum]|uniref:uncharacterized protein n=1 Tax=Penicillium macrosclerotiorum TaxID=303699 RepID=UPI0025489118|nr:uncharacterized protein N7462_001353 [Penicillium macrosclerotiorum]KAJ5691930.1 hypothetical protein N7462_001353 [Penicillium macrosclerotiorum]